MHRPARVLLAAGLVAVVAGSPAAAGPADLASQVLSSGERRGLLVQDDRPAPARPFTRLFQVPPLSPAGAPRPAPRAFPSTPPPPATRGPSVLCGMVVIPADPGIDPKILASPPGGSARYSVRIVPPPACQ